MKLILNKIVLEELYLKNRKSTFDIAKLFGCSEHKINYWLAKYKISKRTISEAIYLKHNPKGDPFLFKKPKNLEEAKLFGIGLGLYWGEGNKANKNAVRLGNSDPYLSKTFIGVLIKFFNINKNRLKFQLQLFSDMDIKEAENHWMKELKFNKKQMYKTIVTKSGSLGTYRKKSKYGVLTIYYGNTKLRNLLVSMLDKYIA